MPYFRISEVAELLGVSDDTVRRWVATGALEAHRDSANRQVIDGEAVAAYAQSMVQNEGGRSSARNRLPGIVTKVTADGVMAQVEIAAGRFRLVSLMSREAADDLGLRPGVIATAVVKSTNVIIDVGDRHA